MTDDQERAAFDEWAISNGYDIKRTHPDAPALYLSRLTEDALFVWKAARAYLSVPAPADVTGQTCEWETNDDPDFSWWDSGCGRAWTFMAGGPKENGMAFCPYCGKPLAVAEVPK